MTFDEKEFRLKLDNINQAIINDLGEDFEYRAKSYITSTHETRKDALIERNKNRWNKIKSFYEILLAMIFIF
ncbi:MAG: hypothetical protein HWD59_00070 [Coxiellaceae bacterium]|nr:MAG: hypothetical protein HWD59_00070 [Coxiellaceae bacterium]